MRILVHFSGLELLAKNLSSWRVIGLMENGARCQQSDQGQMAKSGYSQLLSNRLVPLGGILAFKIQNAYMESVTAMREW
jgi:hypothetical protein